MNDITLSRDNLLQFKEELIVKMNISEKTKSISNKIEKKCSIRLRQTAKISTLSSGNISEYEFLTGKYVL